jgi:hypothetical protein
VHLDDHGTRAVGHLLPLDERLLPDADMGLVEALLTKCFVGLQDPQVLGLRLVVHVCASAGFVAPV